MEKLINCEKKLLENQKLLSIEVFVIIDQIYGNRIIELIDANDSTRKFSINYQRAFFSTSGIHIRINFLEISTFFCNFCHLFVILILENTGSSWWWLKINFQLILLVTDFHVQVVISFYPIENNSSYENQTITHFLKDTYRTIIRARKNIR